MSLCRYCRERIPDDSDAIEDMDGAAVCEPCQENQYRTEPCEGVRMARAERNACPDCGAKGWVGGGYSCGGHCLSCRGLYTRPKPTACTGPHNLLRDLQDLDRKIAETPQVYE